MYFLHLVLVFFICTAELEATEYYVQPTEPPGTSCPGQPCLTLSQYSDLINLEQGFGSDAVFKFLPGTHNVSSPLTFTNASNVSLIGTQSNSESDLPVLITQSFACFYCDERNHSGCDFCSVLYFGHATGVRIEGLHIIVTANATAHYELNGIILQYPNSFAMNNVRIVYHTERRSFGISIGFSRDININYTTVQSTHNGVLLYSTSHVTLNNSAVQNISTGHFNSSVGISLYEVNDTEIVNTVVKDYSEALYLIKGRNTAITTVTVSSAYLLHSFYDRIGKRDGDNLYGITLFDAKNTTLLNVLANHGIYAMKMEDVFIIDSIVQNSIDAIRIENSTSVRIHGGHLHMLMKSAISAYHCSEVVVAYTHIENTHKGFGIFLLKCSNITVDNVGINTEPIRSISNSAINEMKYLPLSKRIVNNDQQRLSQGIGIWHSKNVSISRTAVNSTGIGVYWYSSSHVSLTNSTVYYTSTKKVRGSGVAISAANDTAIVDSVVWDYSDADSIPKISSKVWSRAIVVLNAKNTAIVRVTVSYAYIENSIYDKLNLTHKADGYCAACFIIYSFNIGIFIKGAKNITILQTRVENFNNGISTDEVEDISIVDSKVNNSIFAIFLLNSNFVRVQRTYTHRAVMNGLSLQNCSEVNVTETHIEDTYVKYGVIIFNSSNITIDKTVVECSNKNESEVHQAISVGAKPDSYCLPYVGIGVFNSTSTSINEVTIQFAFTAAITTVSSSFIAITNVSIRSVLQGDGVKAVDSTDTEISNITIADVLNGICIFLDNTTNMTIKTSILMHCYWAGIHVYQGTNISLVSTYVSDSRASIYVENTMNNLVDTVQISNTGFGIFSFNSTNLTLRGVNMDAIKGVFIWFSNHIFLSNMIANSTDTGIVSANSSKVNLKDCIVKSALSPIVIVNSNHTNITNLTLSTSHAQIDIILSEFVFVQSVHTDQEIFARNVRFVIGNATDVYLSNISLIKGSNVLSKQGTGGQLDISQSMNIIMSNVSFSLSKQSGTAMKRSIITAF